MRLALVIAAVCGAVALAPIAEADVGPIEPCPPGRHHEYMMGRRCVKNGYHLEYGPDERPVEVENAQRTVKSAEPSEGPATAPSSTAFATPPGPSAKPQAAPEASPTAPAATTPSSSGCSCASGRSSSRPIMGLATFALAAVLGRRRRRS